MQSRTRKQRSLSLVVGRWVMGLCAVGALVAGAPDAYAAKGKKKGKKRPQEVEMVQPAHSPDVDANGVVRVTVQNNGKRKLVIKLRDLDPKTRYEVRDALTDAVLGTVRTNKKGKAKLRIKDGGRRSDAPKLAEADDLEVTYEDDGECVLEADLSRVEAGEEEPAAGFAILGGEETNLSFSLFTDPEYEFEEFYASLCIDGADAFYDFSAFVEEGEGDLPLGVDSVEDLAERAFRVTDVDGDVVFEGDLPALETLDFEDFGDFDDMDWDDFDDFDDMGEFDDFDDMGDFGDFDLFGDFDFDGPTGENPVGQFDAPFTLEIADADGVLTDVGTFEAIELPDFQFGFGLYGDEDGINASVAIDTVTEGDFSMEAFEVFLEIPGDDGSSAYELFLSEEDTLPAAFTSAADLAERAFEIRNANGAAVITGTLPAFGNDWEDEDIEFTGTAATEAGAAPFDLFVADDDGLMTDVGELEEFDLGDFGDFRSGFALYGNEDGIQGSVEMDAFPGCPEWGDDEDEEHQSFYLSLCIPGDDDTDTDELLFDLYADGESGLPLDAESIDELEGRAFEVRNADGDAILSGDLPDLTSGFGFWEDFDFEGSAADEAGSAPYTLFLANDAGTLTEIDDLAEVDWDADWDMDWDDMDWDDMDWDMDDFDFGDDWGFGF